jgi:glycosyltransferase involved in cell wall biosynthesis
MVYEKGYDFLLEVIKKISISHSDWEFRIIGDGPLENKILKQIELSGFKEKISLISSTKFILEEYLNASIFLMTSRKEGLPMVLLEAQVCGLPIVSFDCETGPSDIVVDNANGFLIDCFDIEKMVQKISLLCYDYDLRVKFGKDAVENVKKFSPEAINSKWEKLFEELSQR